MLSGVTAKDYMYNNEVTTEKQDQANDLSPEEQAMLNECMQEAAEDEKRSERFNFDHETERKILSHLLLNPDIISWATGKVTPVCFTDRAHALLLSVCAGCPAEDRDTPDEGCGGNRAG